MFTYYEVFSINIYIYTLYIYIYIYIYTCIYIHIHTYIYFYLLIHMCMYMYTFMFTYIHIYITHTYIYILCIQNMYTYVYIYIYSSPWSLIQEELKDLGLVGFSTICGPGGEATPPTTDLFLYSRGCFAGGTSRCGMAYQGPDGIMAAISRRDTTDTTACVLDTPMDLPIGFGRLPSLNQV